MLKSNKEPVSHSLFNSVYGTEKDTQRKTVTAIFFCKSTLELQGSVTKITA